MIGPHSVCINKALKKISVRYSDYKKFLDLGCGSGERTLLFSEFSRQINGVDFRDWRMPELKNKIKFEQDDFSKPGLKFFKDESFDIVFSFDVIEHLNSPAEMINNARRVLRKDGIFVISTPNRNRLLGLPLIIMGLRSFPYFPDEQTSSYDPFAAHVCEYTVKELTSLLEDCGFEVIHTHKLFYGLTGGLGIDNLFGLPLFHNIILECIKK